jgi:serine/threonine protein kinase
MAARFGFFKALCGFVALFCIAALPAKDFKVPYTVKAQAKSSKKQSAKAWAHTIKVYADSENYRALGYVLKAAHQKGMSFTSFYKVAKEIDCIPLLKALSSSKKMMALGSNIGLQRMHCLQLALFIEGDLPKEILEGRSYFGRKSTGLAHSIEYDPESKLTFIHLKTHNGIAPLGKGFKKVVTKSILYDAKKPELVAHCLTKVPMGKEIEALKMLQGLPGILEYKAITTRQVSKKKTHYSLMCKLYKYGQLSNFGPTKKYRPNLKEKLALAVDILRGLETMHTRGYVHRDLNTRNVLVDDACKEQLKKGERFRAVIVDLGRTLRINKTKRHPAQGNVFYLAPEGLAYRTMAPKEYYQTDIYAAGCVLQRLSTGKVPPWVRKDIMRDSTKSINNRISLAKKVLAKYHKERSALLDKRYGTRADIPPVEGLERVILQMVDPNPRKRPTATQARRLLERYLYVAELNDTGRGIPAAFQETNKKYDKSKSKGKSSRNKSKK